MISHLIKSRHQNCFLLDRDFESGDEPVKLCVRDDKIIEFRKWLSADFDFNGESVGFLKLSTAMAKKLIIQTGHYIRQGRHQEPYEEAIRDVLLTSPRDTFGFEDITGRAWIVAAYVFPSAKLHGVLIAAIVIELAWYLRHKWSNERQLYPLTEHDLLVLETQAKGGI